jgi:uncharacterized membrane protein YccF (DUF307 family)
MLCRTCDAPNNENARFCHSCGTAMNAEVVASPVMTGPTCPACGSQNPGGARFCVFCATNLVAAPPAYASPKTAKISYTPPAQPAAYSPSLAYATPSAPTVNVVTNVNYAAPSLTPMTNAGFANLLVRAVWFFFVGWWLGLVWTIFAWLFNLTLIGLPIGVMMLNATPTITTLQQRSRRQSMPIPQPGVAQHPFLLRAIWFVLIGWWASLLWSMMAWGFSLTWIMLPISFWMWNRVPTITTLAMEP